MASFKRLSVWGVVVAIVLYFYMDAHIPESFPQKFKLGTMDAFMKTYGNVVSIYVNILLTFVLYKNGQLT